MTDERFLCRCPTGCAVRATQEDGLCDTCRFVTVAACDPAPSGESSVLLATKGCLHAGPIGAQRMWPFRRTDVHVQIEFPCPPGVAR